MIRLCRSLKTAIAHCSHYLGHLAAVGCLLLKLCLWSEK